jgi:hypothetical protein
MYIMPCENIWETPMSKGLSLSRELLLTLTLKLLILYAIWWLCFSHPLEKHLIPADMVSHLFITTPQKVTHD